jgi:hypothetical protein
VPGLMPDGRKEPVLLTARHWSEKNPCFCNFCATTSVLLLLAQTQEIQSNALHKVHFFSYTVLVRAVVIRI